MRVLVLATDIYTRGGIARYSWSLSSALGGLIGPENVCVLSLLNRGGSHDLPRSFRILGTVAEQTTTVSKLRFVGRAVRLARGDFDLIICNHVGTAQAALVIHELYGKPFWIVCHGWEVWGRLTRIKRLTLKKAELLLPISRFTASNLANEKGIEATKIRILYNAIADDFVHLLVSENIHRVPRAIGEIGDARILLSVGNLSQGLEYKGFDVVIRALPRILRESPQVRYVIVGGGPGRDTLQRSAEQLGVAEKVIFTGELSDAELASCYQACDVFVLPSGASDLKGGWHGEGFGRVYVEASLAGKPLVASLVGGAPEAVLDGQTGLLVNPGSPEELAQAVTTLLKQPDLAKGLGRAGRKWALENFTSEAMQKSLRRILHSSRFVPGQAALAQSRML